MDALARAIEFERGWLRGPATTLAAVRADGREVGEVLLTAPVPRIRDHNAVVLGPAPELDGPAVVELLDRELGGRDVRHRRLYCATDDAARWARSLLAAGYEVADTVVLRWSGPAPPVAALPGVEIVRAEADLAATATRVLRATDLDVPAAEELVEQLVWLTRAHHRAGVRMWVALEDGRPVGNVRVHRGEDVAQIEELDVHPDAQGRGVGRALVTTALAASADAALVVTTADPDDWPAGWYERLGFVPLGRSAGFTRAATPDAA